MTVFNVLLLVIRLQECENDNGDSIPVIVNDDNFDSDTVGLYQITYTATDPNNNIAEEHFNLEVKVGNPPTLTINGYNDGDIITVNQNDLGFSLPTATAIDAQNNSVDVEINEEVFDITTVGTYTMIYSVTDRFNLTIQKSLIINVLDVEPPVITNANELLLKKGIFIDNTSLIDIATVQVSDNVGINTYSYSIQEVNTISGTPMYDVNWYTSNFNGIISISSDGKIRASKPWAAPGLYTYSFKIEVEDTSGNKATTFMQLRVLETTEPDIQAREFEESIWQEIRYLDSGVIPSGSVGTLTYEIDKQDNLNINDEIFFINSDMTPYTFQRYELSGTNSNDFFFENEFSSNTSLKLANLLDANIIPQYNIRINVVGKLNPSDPDYIIPIDIIINVNSVNALAPALADVIGDLPIDPATGAPEPLTIENMAETYGVSKPNANIFPNGYMDVFTANLVDLPIIDNTLSVHEIKALIQKLPYALWISKEGNLIRTYVKFIKNNTTVQIEFIVDPDNNATYWQAKLEPPSNLSNKLGFLDHMDTGIVFTNNTIDASNFDCLPLPSTDQLQAGIHFLAKGRMFEYDDLPTGLPSYSNPNVEARISVTDAGWTVPDLTASLKMSTNFFNFLDREIIEHLINQSNTARTAILAAEDAIEDAKVILRDAKIALNAAQYPFMLAERAYNTARHATGVSSLEFSLNIFNQELANVTAARNVNLAKEICGPNVCLPYIYPKFCKAAFVYYPCGFGKSYNCFDGCIPDPVAIAEAAAQTIYIASLETIILTKQAALASANLALETPSLTLQAAEQAFNQAELAVDAAELSLTAAQQALITTEQGFGTIGEVARYFLDVLPSISHTTSATFITTASSANNGTYSGTLNFKLKFKGGADVDRTASFSFSDPVGSAVSIANSLIN